MKRPKQTGVLTDSYSGYLERYNPFSTNRDTITVGLPGDAVEIQSRWRDLKSNTTWLQVKVEGKEGWMLESEIALRPKE